MTHDQDIIITTGFTVPNREIDAIVGIAKGGSVRARHVGRDILAFFRCLTGGEVHEYTKILAETREQALDRMIDHAKVMGADAVIGFRFVSSEIASHAAEILAYGTAVKLK
jgi:uncharacterized protein YbjQ (UPF0145 family)